VVSNYHRDATPDELHVAGPPTIVRAASTANVTLASAVENGDTLDGLTLATGDRILLKDQTTGSENGIYVVAASGAPTRATDFNTAAKMREGLLIRVQSGTANSNTLWQHTTTGTITVGTTALTFAAVGTGGGSGTVTSVALTAPAEFSVSGSPVTTTGTLAITKANESANQVWAGPTSGGAAAPAFRALVSGDLPSAPTVSGEVTAADFKAAGLTGAVSASRYVGATASIAPTTGTFALGDFVITQTGKIYVCTVAGSPGTWVQVGAGGAASMTIQEVDTSPSVSATTLIFPNGTLTDNGGGSVTYTPAGGGGGLYTAYLRYTEEQTSGTNAGTFTSGAWRTRTITNERDDTANHGSLASNQITLDAGTYHCKISCPAHAVNSHQARLQNITDTTTTLTGTSEYAHTLGYAQTRSIISGRFTLASSKALEIQHQCGTTSGGTYGMGQSAGFGTEVYTIAEFWKE
jgi:hypothetical protein